MSACAKVGTMYQIALALESRISYVGGDFTRQIDAAEQLCNELASRHGYTCTIHSADIKPTGDVRYVLAIQCNDSATITTCYATYTGIGYNRLIDFYCYRSIRSRY